MTVKITSFKNDHWPAVAEIYRLGLLTRKATFETEVPEYQTWIGKFHKHLLWVALNNNEVIGWAGLSSVSIRKAYAGVAEVTIYIHPDYKSKGIGKQLMSHLVNESEKAGIWTLYAAIFSENPASIKVHLSNGFREIGYREKIAQLDGEWKNTVLFERRSKKIGI